jgi:non-specific serine/threonine protein kinase
MSGEWSLRSDPWLQRHAEDSNRRSRTTLGAASERAWNEGWYMSLDQAVDYALGQGEPKRGVESRHLSRREREVAKLVATGMTNREIAERLSIAERTAEGHVEQIRNKLGFRSRTQVATWAVQHGFLADQTVAE